jgi:hypothetical protein
MPDINNPVWKIYKQKTGFLSSIITGTGPAALFEKANDSIEEYLGSGSHNADSVKDINDFIKKYNKTVENPEYKINYSVVIDDKGAIYTYRKNQDSEHSFTRIYDPNSKGFMDIFNTKNIVEVAKEVVKNVTTEEPDIENTLRKIAGKDRKIDDSEQGLIDISVEKKESDISTADIKKAYNIIAKDGKITSSENEMFKNLLLENVDISFSTVESLGKGLIHEKDKKPSPRYVDGGAGPEEAKGSLHERYSFEGHETLSVDIPESDATPKKPTKTR